MNHAPGAVRDAIIEFLRKKGGGPATVAEIGAAVTAKLGAVPPSSIRSYLGNNVPGVFTRVSHARYALARK